MHPLTEKKVCIIFLCRLFYAIFSNTENMNLFAVNASYSACALSVIVILQKNAVSLIKMYGKNALNAEL